MKICPECGEKLKPTSLIRVSVDQCPKCKGVWFDHDELRVAKDHADSDLNWLDFEIWKHEDQFAVEPRDLKCPACRTELVAIRYGSTRVTIDYCRNCKGIWLDRGEFKQIIDALEREVTTKTVPEYIKASIEEARELVTGHEGFLSEWRDLKTVLWLLELRFFVEHPRLMQTVSNVPPSPIS
jgi:Zn-finger nucleic acid-binding protein